MTSEDLGSFSSFLKKEKKKSILGIFFKPTAIFKRSPGWEARSAWQGRAAERAELSPTAVLQGAHTSSLTRGDPAVPSILQELDGATPPCWDQAAVL